jgi:enoyl-CoA hydratase/carnithine racemase
MSLLHDAQTPCLKLSVADKVAHLIIDRREKKNALTASMWRDLGNIIGEATASADVRVLEISGTGPDFCAGADIKEFPKYLEGGSRGFVETIHDAINSLDDLAKPTIAAIRRYADTTMRKGNTAVLADRSGPLAERDRAP